MSKNKSLLIIIIVIVSLLIIGCIGYLVFDNSNRINQGKFRVNDAMIQSKVEVQEMQSNIEDTKNIADMSLDLNQKNTLSLLLTKDVKIKELYISDITLKEPNLKGNLGLYIKSNEEDILLSECGSRIDVPYEEYQDQYLVEIGINNNKFLKSAKIPDNVDTVVFDGTILKLLNLNVSDLKFEISFNLNIVDEFDNATKCKITIKAPEDDLSSNGIVVIHEDLNDYIFKKGKNN